jgi:hypothetical protein
MYLRAQKHRGAEMLSVPHVAAQTLGYLAKMAASPAIVKVR